MNSDRGISPPPFTALLSRLTRTSLLACCVALLGPSLAHAQDGYAKPSRPAKARKVVAKPARAVEGGEAVNFAQWGEANQFIEQMVERHGFDKAELQAVLNQARYLDSAIQLIKPAPPTRPKNWRAYRARFVEPVRIDAGVRFWNEHAAALARAEQQYGVPAEIIVGIIGVETVYGRNTGNFRVMDAITTLAFDYPDTPTREMRKAFFRGELENTLLYARELGVDPYSLLGSYAGAIGWPQFMPSSIRKYAVDFDGNGRVDLRNSPVDAIGSVANFLVQHGWRAGEPIIFPATVAAPTANGDGGNGMPPAWERFLGQGLEPKFSLDELKSAGVNPIMDLPQDMRFGLVDLQNGFEATEYWLGANNFFAITQYNRSFFYAMSVVELGKAVRSAISAL